MKKILVLTSGGDASGMNSFLKAFAKLCKKNDTKLFGSMYGFMGLIKNDFVELDYNKMPQFQNMGGTILKSSRCKEFQTKYGFDTAVQNIKNEQFDCIVVVGGNGSFRGAYDLKNAGINVVAVPATIDNDLGYTDLSLGFDTACQNAVDNIVKIKQSMSAFDRGFIAEVMGRTCSDIAIKTAIISNADMCITEKIDFEQVLNLANIKTKNGVKSPLIIVQENLFDVEKLALFLEEKAGREYRSVKIGYVQRGGEPSNVDKFLAIQYATKAFENISKNIFGVAVGKRNNEIICEDLKAATKYEKCNSENLLKLFKEYCF